MCAVAAIRKFAFGIWAVVLTGSQWASAAEAPKEHPGKAVYEQACAACHNNPEATRAPALDTLKGMRYQTLLYALNEGKMKIQAATLSAAQKSAVIDFLVGREATSDEWLAPMMCPAERRKVKLDAPATVTGFGFDPKNHRRLSAAQTAIDSDAATLETLERERQAGQAHIERMRREQRDLPGLPGCPLGQG